MVKSASLRPSEHAETGLFTGNAVLKNPRVILSDFNGKVLPPGPALEATLVDDSGTEHTGQLWSAGKADNFIPSDDGARFVSVGSQESLSKSCNVAMLMAELVNTGFPENKLDEDVTVLDGLYANWDRKKVERRGLVQEEGARPPTVLVPFKILSLPWEKQKAPPTAGAPGIATPTSDVTSGDVMDEALEYASACIGEGITSRKKMVGATFKNLKSNPNRKAIATVLLTPEFAAAAQEAGFTVDGDEVSL